MIRVVIENIILFLFPTLVYVAYVMIRRSDRKSAGQSLDDAPLIWLSIAGAALVIGTLLIFGTTDGGKPGQRYIPPVYKDGKLVPGRVE